MSEKEKDGAREGRRQKDRQIDRQTDQERHSQRDRHTQRDRKNGLFGFLGCVFSQFKCFYYIKNKLFNKQFDNTETQGVKQVTLIGDAHTLLT